MKIHPVGFVDDLLVFSQNFLFVNGIGRGQEKNARKKKSEKTNP